MAASPAPSGAFPSAQITTESSNSAVSWAAIIAGAVVAVAASLLLTVVATGFGLASVSPWARRGVSATAVTALAAIALLVTQWLSAALGGYITGRLRTKWVGTHTHEVFFRDTAHGLLTWAVATVAVAYIVASGATSLVGTGTRDLSTAAAGVVSNAFGRDAGNTPHDAAQSGIAAAEAERRVNDDLARAKAAADSARHDAELASLVSALAMLIGAFIACVSAALGGRERDLHP